MLWSFGAYSRSKKNAKLLEKYAMPKSPMETVLQAGINGSTRGYFFCSNPSPYNEPHLGGIQRKTQRSASHLNSKYETRSTKQIQNSPSDSPPCGRVPSFEFSNVQNVTSRKDLSGVSVIWILVIRICFGFRYSDFGFTLDMCLCGESSIRPPNAVIMRRNVTDR